MQVLWYQRYTQVLEPRARDGAVPNYTSKEEAYRYTSLDASFRYNSNAEYWTSVVFHVAHSDNERVAPAQSSTVCADRDGVFAKHTACC